MTASVLPTFRLDGKVAVVAGASRNVGLAILQAFADAGASLFMAARDDEALEAGAQSIRETTGASVITVAADVGSAKGTDQLLDAVHDSVGQAHALVNNAMSTAHREKSFDASDDGWKKSLNVNLLGHTIVRAAASVVARSRGRRQRDERPLRSRIRPGARVRPVRLRQGWALDDDEVHVDGVFAQRAVDALVPSSTVEPERGERGRPRRGTSTRNSSRWVASVSPVRSRPPPAIWRQTRRPTALVRSSP